MLLALGNIPLSPLLSAITHMAQDQTTHHERNQINGLGSFKHSDGWGIAYQQDNHWIIQKSLAPLYEDQISIIPLQKITSPITLIHVRKTSGTNICPENTHPFYYKHPTLGEIIFCHNGSIKEPIPYDQTIYKPQGTTDSEKIFYAILTLAQTHPITQAISHTLNQFKNHAGSNIILITKETTYIAIAPHKDKLYYQMSLAHSQNNEILIVSSEKIPHTNSTENLPPLTWTTLPQNTFLTIDNNTKKYTTEQLFNTSG